MECIGNARQYNTTLQVMQKRISTHNRGEVLRGMLQGTADEYGVEA
tara:strand:+ start:2021 stop:2158 length:138 start_codon:yes stop_codon:yes gene_type:complete